MGPLGALEPLLSLGEGAIYGAFAVFLRVGATVALLPGFGETALPMRIKLMAALMFGLIIWPAVAPLAVLSGVSAVELGRTFIAEAVAGLILGMSIRLMIFALQIAGSIAAQSTAIAQMFGQGLLADPQPAFANLLAISGIVLAFALGLPAYAASALIGSYDALPFGTFPLGGELADWGVRRVGGAFFTALSLAAPFVVMAFIYNVALGAINRAMPQLMVAFVGAPAISAGALLMMGLTTPILLHVWGVSLLAIFNDPLGAMP